LSGGDKQNGATKSVIANEISQMIEIRDDKKFPTLLLYGHQFHLQNCLLRQGKNEYKLSHHDFSLQP